MADPHQILLPSAADLTQAFLRDLSNVLDIERGESPWLSVFLFAGTGAAASWTTDRAVMLRGVLNVSGTGSSILNLDAATYTATFAAAGSGKKNVIWIGGTSQQVFSPLTWPVPASTKVTFTNNSASNGAILLYYT